MCYVWVDVFPPPPPTDRARTLKEGLERAARAPGQRKITDSFGGGANAHPPRRVENTNAVAAAAAASSATNKKAAAAAEEEAHRKQLRDMLAKIKVEDGNAARRGDTRTAKMLQAMVMFATCQLHHGMSALQAARATSKLTWPPGSEKREVTLKTGKKAIWGNDCYYRRGSERIRAAWAYFNKTDTVNAEMRGRGATPSLINDEDIQDRMRAVIKKLPKRWSAREFQAAASLELASDGMIPAGKYIGRAACSNWINALGMHIVESKMGIYKDGHEAPEQVKYRQWYGKHLEEHVLPYVAAYEGDNMEIEVLPDLGPGQYEHILVYQDECIYATNEDRARQYCENDREAGYHKTKGAAFMVSGFITDKTGQIRIPADKVGKFKKAHPGSYPMSSKMYAKTGDLCGDTFIEPGSSDSKDGWWTGEDTVAQTKEVANMLMFLHPKAIFVFVYDRSTGHGTHAPDALKVLDTWTMKGDGINDPGAQARTKKSKVKKTGNKSASVETDMAAVPKLRDGWYINPLDGQKTAHSLHHHRGGKFKGVKRILEERRAVGNCNPAYKDGLRRKCTLEQRAKWRAHHGVTEEKAFDLGYSAGCRIGDPCCCYNALNSQPDFKAQKPYLQEYLESLGHKCLMLPKMHPELNPIESRWQGTKVHTRMMCEYSIASLRLRVPEALQVHSDNVRGTGLGHKVQLAHVRRWYRRAHRFASMYLREGDNAMPWRLREFIMKKYSCHRRVPADVLTIIDRDLAGQEADRAARVHEGRIDRAKLERVQALRKDVRSYQGGALNLRK